MSLSPLHVRSTPNQAVHQVIASRAVIDQAKGVLILRFRVDAEGAFKMLRAWAAETGSTLQVVAQTLVHGVVLKDTFGTWDPAVLAYVAAALGEPMAGQSRTVPHPRPS
jgi:hypothetical protein